MVAGVVVMVSVAGVEGGREVELELTTRRPFPRLWAPVPSRF